MFQAIIILVPFMKSFLHEHVNTEWRQLLWFRRQIHI